MDYIFNELLEEEVEIINVFRQAMKDNGHDGYYSFYEDIDNGYFIYREDGIWHYELYNKGKVIREEEYTNIYNLCLDILNEMKIDNFLLTKLDLKIPRGTKVIISKSTDHVIDEIYEGTILDSDLVRFENNQTERIYQVLGDDGCLYTGIYGLRIYGDTCFRTMEDFINDADKESIDMMQTIKELADNHWNLYLLKQEVVLRKKDHIKKKGEKHERN